MAGRVFWCGAEAEERHGTTIRRFERDEHHVFTLRTRENNLFQGVVTKTSDREVGDWQAVRLDSDRSRSGVLKVQDADRSDDNRVLEVERDNATCVTIIGYTSILLDDKSISLRDTVHARGTWLSSSTNTWTTTWALLVGASQIRVGRSKQGSIIDAGSSIWSVATTSRGGDCQAIQAEPIVLDVVAVRQRFVRCLGEVETDLSRSW